MSDENDGEKEERIHVDVKIDEEKAWKARSVEQVIRRLIKRAENVGLDVSEDQIQSEQDIINLKQNIDEKTLELAEQKEAIVKRRAPSGVVPLRGQDLPDYYNEEGEYSSYGEMFADLHRKLHHGDKFEQAKAKEILGKLSVNALKALKRKNQEIDIRIPTDEQIKAGISTVDLLNDWWRRTQKKDE
jgi:hypothetical protein